MKGPVVLDRQRTASLPTEDLLIVPLDPRSREEASRLPAWEEVRTFAQAVASVPGGPLVVRFQGFPRCVVPDGESEPGAPRTVPAACLECRRRPECPGPGTTRTLILGCEGLAPEAPGRALIPARLYPVQARSGRPFDPVDCPFRRGDRPLPQDPCFLWTSRSGQGIRWVFPPGETTAFDLARTLGLVENEAGEALVRDPACGDCPLAHRCGGVFRRGDGSGNGMRPLEPADRVIGPFRAPEVDLPVHRLLQERDVREPHVRRVALDSALGRLPDLDSFWTALQRRFPDLEELQWREPLPVLRLIQGEGGVEGAIPLPGALVRWFRRHRWRPVASHRVDLRGRPGWLTVLRLDPPDVADIQSLSVQFTEMCIANCVMCNVAGHFKRPRVPFPEVTETLFEVAASGVRKIDLFGGEITLRRDLFRLLTLARDLGMTPMFVTTGHFLTPAYVRRLAEAGLSGCNVSLDGSRPEIHDRIRNSPGLFRRAIRGLRALLQEPASRSLSGP